MTTATSIPRAGAGLRSATFVAGGLAAAAISGALVVSSWPLAFGAILGAAFLLWAISRPEHAALGVLFAMPFCVYPVTVGNFSVFMGLPLVVAVSVFLLVGHGPVMPLLSGRLPIGLFAIVLAFALAATALSTDPLTAGSRTAYLATFGLFAWALAAALSQKRLTASAVAHAIVYGAALAGIALIVQVMAQFASGGQSVTDWLQSVSPLFAGSRAAANQTQLNWAVDGLQVGGQDFVRGVFPFMSAPGAGQYMMLALICAIWLRRERRWSSPAQASVDLAAILIIVTALLMTYSRQAWIGAIVGVVALAAKRRPVWTLAIAAELLLVLSVMPLPGSNGSFGDYLMTAGDTSTASSSQRIDLWNQSFHLMGDRLAIGVGPGLYPTLNPDPANPVYYAHNLFLDEAVELGVVGGLVLAALFVFTMRSALSRTATLGFALLSGFVIANVFDDAFYLPRNGFVLAAAFALATVSDDRPRRAPPPAHSNGNGHAHRERVPALISGARPARR